MSRRIDGTRLALGVVGTVLVLATSGCDAIVGNSPDAEATFSQPGAPDANPPTRPGISKAEAFKACSDWLNRESVRWTLDPASTVISRSGKLWIITGVGLDHGTGELDGSPVQVSCSVQPDGTVQGEDGS